MTTFWQNHENNLSSKGSVDIWSPRIFIATVANPMIECSSEFYKTFTFSDNQPKSINLNQRRLSFLSYKKKFFVGYK